MKKPLFKREALDADVTGKNRWRRLGASIAVATFVAVPLTAAPVAAEQSQGKGGAYPFFAYLSQGERLMADLQKLDKVIDSSGKEVSPESGKTYAPEENAAGGIWQIYNKKGTRLGENSNLARWTITVQRPVAGNWEDVPGRVWTNLYYLNQGAALDPAPAIDANYWILNDSGYLYNLIMKDYNGLASRIRADAIGNVTKSGTCRPAYKSLESAEEYIDIPDCGGVYRIFFDQPDDALPEYATMAGEKKPVKPKVLTAKQLRDSPLTFTPSPTGAEGTLSWSIDKRFTGQYWLQIDVDGNDSFDDSADKKIEQYADGSGTYTYAYSPPPPPSPSDKPVTVPQARLLFEKAGEVHVVQEDVEQRGSITLTRVNGEGAPDSTIYWDDTGLDNSARRSTSGPKDGTKGVDSAKGVHGWSMFEEWGNARVMDDWAYTKLNAATEPVPLAIEPEVSLDKQVSASNVTVGDTITYTVKATNTGKVDYTPDRPLVVTDDFSRVASIGAPAGKPTTDKPGAFDVQQPLVTWAGPLKQGETVTLTFPVKVTAAGAARNTVYVGDPATKTPSCDARTPSGRGKATDIPCAVADVTAVASVAPPPTPSAVLPPATLTPTEPPTVPTPLEPAPSEPTPEAQPLAETGFNPLFPLGAAVLLLGSLLTLGLRRARLLQ